MEASSEEKAIEEEFDIIQSAEVHEASAALADLIASQPAIPVFEEVKDVSAELLESQPESIEQPVVASQRSA